MIGRSVEGDACVPVAGVSQKHDPRCQMQSAIAAKLRSLLLHRNVGADSSVEIARHIAGQALLHMLAQGIANRNIFAGNLNLHDFESTKAPACQGGFVQSTRKPLTFLRPVLQAIAVPAVLSFNGRGS
jgi:hypothetical protein